MKKPKLTRKELADIEVRKEKAKAEYMAKHKDGPGPVTSIDVAKLLGMPDEMIEELFGKEEPEGDDATNKD